MKNKNLRVLIISTLIGVIVSIIEYGLIKSMIKGTNEWTIEMSDNLLIITMFLTLSLLLVSCMMFFRDMKRNEIARSATMVVGYYVLVLIIERIIFDVGFYSLSSIYTIMVVPIRMYTTLTQLTMRLMGITWIGIILSLISPYIFVLFARKKSGKVI